MNETLFIQDKFGEALPFLNNNFFQYHLPPETFLSSLADKLMYISSNVLPNHQWWTITAFFLLTFIIGEFMFIRRIRNNKISYIHKDNTDKRIKDIKIESFGMAFVMSLLIMALGSFVLPLLLLMVVVLIWAIVVNFGYILLILFESAVCFAAGFILIKYGFELLYVLNKKICGRFIKVETEEEFNKRQESYKFKDGEEVKLKNDLIIDNGYGTKDFTSTKAKYKDKLLVVDRHRDNPTEMRLCEKETEKECIGVYTDEMLCKIKSGEEDGSA